MVSCCKNTKKSGSSRGFSGDIPPDVGTDACRGIPPDVGTDACRDIRRDVVKEA
jgi:hypothetical protein